MSISSRPNTYPITPLQIDTNQAFQRVKHGHIKASLKEISAAIKYKKENTIQGDHHKSSTCISPIERVDPRISKQETVLELAPSLRQIRVHGGDDKSSITANSSSPMDDHISTRKDTVMHVAPSLRNLNAKVDSKDKTVAK